MLSNPSINIFKASWVFFLNINFHFDAVIDSHAVVRNNTERFCVFFYPVSLAGNIFQKYSAI